MRLLETEISENTYRYSGELIPLDTINTDFNKQSESLLDLRHINIDAGLLINIGDEIPISILNEFLTRYDV